RYGYNGSSSTSEEEEEQEVKSNKAEPLEDGCGSIPNGFVKLSSLSHRHQQPSKRRSGKKFLNAPEPEPRHECITEENLVSAAIIMLIQDIESLVKKGREYSFHIERMPSIDARLTSSNEFGNMQLIPQLKRTFIYLIGVLLFLPLFGLVTLLLPVFVVIKQLGFTDPNVRLGSTVVALMVALLGSCFLAINRTTPKFITIAQVLICLIEACVLTFPYMTSSFKDATQ
uniref:Uncharacterized protein n=1 Tax=Glossina morsitans morsitans TaxID=37546 RepID=A0A1B0F9Z0_GLOMM